MSTSQSMPAVFNLTDKRYWHWGDVQGLSSNDAGLTRASQAGRHAAVNLISGSCEELCFNSYTLEIF